MLLIISVIFLISLTIPSVNKSDRGRVAAKARAKTAGNTQHVRIIPTTAVMKQGNPIVFN